MRCAPFCTANCAARMCIVVSNREPYIHQRRGDRIEVQRPASGLVTALEPIMRACSGTWVAHGSGSADREVVDSNDRVAVPPENPAYPMRRVWLTRGRRSRLLLRFCQRRPLAALPHRPHAADFPLGRLGAVRRGQPQICRGRGQRGQDQGSHRPGAGLPLRPAAANDPRGTAGCHDHHFLAHSLAQPRVFRHLPVARRSAGRDCSGSSILGFHTQFHCNNFVETVDRLLEARVDREILHRLATAAS